MSLVSGCRPKIREGIEKAFEVKNEDGLEMFAEAILGRARPLSESCQQNMADPGWYLPSCRGGKRCWYDQADFMATMLAFVFTDAPVDQKISRRKFGR